MLRFVVLVHATEYTNKHYNKFYMYIPCLRQWLLSELIVKYSKCE